MDHETVTMQISRKFFFASELDGTLLPNGMLRAAGGCLDRTRQLLARLKEEACPIIYVTNSDLALAQAGPQTFQLSEPDYWICNAGTEIYDGKGKSDSEWEQMMGPTFDQASFLAVLKGNPKLAIQEEEQQGPHKFGLYYPGPIDDTLRSWILTRAQEVVDDVGLVEGLEQSSGQTSIDIIPANAGKMSALQYLAEKLGFSERYMFFSGEAASDFDILTSGICGTLVGNTFPMVQEQARTLVETTGNARLSLSQGYYGDGIIEGLMAHGFVVWAM